MKSYVTFTRKSLFVCVLLLICSLLICNQLYYAINTGENALTNAKRLDCLKNAGYTVLCDEPTVQTVIVPEIFTETYNNYNDLQLSSGYDLSQYKGCEITVYSYKINALTGYDGESIANLIVYNNRIIGGDVTSVVLGGYILPLNLCK